MLCDDMKKKEAPADEPRKVGRPPKSESGAAVAMTIKLAPVDLEEFRHVAAELQVPQSEIVRYGIAEGRRRLAKRTKAVSTRNGETFVGKRRRRVAP